MGTSAQHSLGEVAGHNPRTGLGQLDSRHRGAGCQVQDFLSGFEVQAVARFTSPIAVLPEGKDGVGDVVLLAHAVKHARNIKCLLI